MTLDQVVTWVIVGGIAGLLAEIFVKGVKVGLVGTVVIGILGALFGGWLFRQLHITLMSGVIGEILTAAAGAVILLFLYRTLKRL
jgi:uncharacterized membrane protein YeaQ/YmgE (transglycosylase-associated protein family)